MSASFPRAARLLLAAALTLLPGAALAATVEFRIDRTSADPEERTFSGSGLIEFDGPTSDLADIGLLSLEITTMGSVFLDEVETPATYLFSYDVSDIASVSGLAVVGSGLIGSINLASKDATGHDVSLDIFLDFTAGTADGFCIGGESRPCIFGGGSSSSVDAILSVAPIPLPASLPLLALAAGGLGVLARRRRVAHPC